jgi:hypothetical protein
MNCRVSMRRRSNCLLPPPALDGALRAVFFWEESGLVLDDPRANPYGGLLARSLAPHGVTLEAGWAIDPAWVRRQHARGVQLLHLNWLHRFYIDPHLDARRTRFRSLVTSLVLARRLGTRLAWTVHNLYPHEVHDRGRPVCDRRFEMPGR